MAPKTNLNNCEAGHCDDHSGMVERDNNMMTWQKGTFALMAFCAGLLGYSVLWQAPNIKLDVAREIARLNMRDSEICNDVKNIQKDLATHDRRISLLESR